MRLISKLEQSQVSGGLLQSDYEQSSTVPSWMQPLDASATRTTGQNSWGENQQVMNSCTITITQVDRSPVCTTTVGILGPNRTCTDPSTTVTTGFSCPPGAK